MKPLTLFAFSTFVLLATGCASITEDCRRKDVIYNGSEIQVETEALSAARNDIARGRPKICYSAIGFGAINSPIGIPKESISLVQNLSRIQLPNCGCLITPEVSRGMHFGAFYNKEILQYLQTHKMINSKDRQSNTVQPATTAP